MSINDVFDDTVRIKIIKYSNKYVWDDVLNGNKYRIKYMKESVKYCNKY